MLTKCQRKQSGKSQNTIILNFPALDFLVSSTIVLIIIRVFFSKKNHLYFNGLVNTENVNF